MLVGPPHRAFLPRVPVKEEGLDGIFRYLEDFDRAAANYLSSIVANSVGMLGVRGLSSSGTIARNFTKQSLQIGGLTEAAWVFTGLEADASFMIFASFSSTTGIVMTSTVQQTTQVLLRFNPAAPSGALVNVLLLR